MPCSSQAAPGLLGDCAACPQLLLLLLSSSVALSCTVSQLPEPSLFAGWTASMAWRALSLERCLFGIFCLPQCDGSEMKSSFYSSVNGCTWFAAMMHIPGGQAVTLPDFFFNQDNMQARRHSRDGVLLLSNSPSQRRAKSLPSRFFPLGPLM